MRLIGLSTTSTSRLLHGSELTSTMIERAPAGLQYGRGAFESASAFGHISGKTQVQLRASAASRFHEFAIPRKSVNARSRLCASVVLQGSGFDILRDRNSVRPPADAGARCRAAHRATLGVSPLRLPSLTPARFACCSGQQLGAGLLFPSPYHGVLAVKVCACLARWRPAAVCEP